MSLLPAFPVRMFALKKVNTGRVLAYNKIMLILCHTFLIEHFS